jgi:hypothetical protein
MEAGGSPGDSKRESYLSVFVTVLEVALIVACMVALVVWYYAWYTPEPLYLCKGCPDEAYREIATRCYGVKELFIRSGEKVSFAPSDGAFYDNATCVPSDGMLIWVNITSGNPVRVIIHSKVFEGTRITYGCINMKNVAIMAPQDTRVVVEVREITPCIYGKPYRDFHRLHEALPNLHDDQDCS